MSQLLARIHCVNIPACRRRIAVNNRLKVSEANCITPHIEQTASSRKLQMFSLPSFLLIIVEAFHSTNFWAVIPRYKLMIAISPLRSIMNVADDDRLWWSLFPLRSCHVSMIWCRFSITDKGIIQDQISIHDQACHGNPFAFVMKISILQHMSSGRLAIIDSQVLAFITSSL